LHILDRDLNSLETHSRNFADYKLADWPHSLENNWQEDCKQEDCRQENYMQEDCMQELRVDNLQNKLGNNLGERNHNFDQCVDNPLLMEACYNCIH
jgi:hypothetical protein